MENIKNVIIYGKYKISSTIISKNKIMTSRTMRKLSESGSVTPKYFLKTCSLKDVVYEKKRRGDLRKVVSVDEKTPIFKALKKMKDEGVNTIAIYRKNLSYGINLLYY